MRLLLTVVFGLGLVAMAHANGAMGLGLEMFEPTYWFAYVVAMVGLEAWLIGRFFGLSWGRSILCSIVANFITGFFCGFSGCLAPFLHQSFVGSPADPQPFWNAVALLSVFAIPSALIESVAWRLWIRTKETSDWKILGRSVLIHLATVPIALVILLIPAQPYQGAYGEARFRDKARGGFSEALANYIAERKTLPTAQSFEELTKKLEPFFDKFDRETVLKAFRESEVTRFGMKYEPGMYSVAVNRSLSGAKMTPNGDTNWVEYLAPTNRKISRFGLWVDLQSGQTDWSTSPLSDNGGP